MKKYAIFGQVVGVLFVIVGLLTLIGVFAPWFSYGSSSTDYDHGYAKFGADYYTYSVNNTAHAAEAAADTAKNVAMMSKMNRECFGVFFIGFGLVTICGFGIVSAKCKEMKKVEETAKTLDFTPQTPSLINSQVPAPINDAVDNNPDTPSPGC